MMPCGVKLRKHTNTTICVDSVGMVRVFDGVARLDVSNPSGRIMFHVQYRRFVDDLSRWSYPGAILTDGKSVWAVGLDGVVSLYCSNPLPRKPIRLAIGKYMAQMRQEMGENHA